MVGAIDLSMEEMTDGEEEPESVELTSEQIPVGGAGKLKKHSGASFTMEDIIAVDEKMKMPETIYRWWRRAICRL